MFSLNISLCINSALQTKWVKTGAFITSAYNMARTNKLGMRPSTVKNYITALNSLSVFVSVHQERYLTPSCLVKYEAWLKDNGKNRNTTSCYIRSLRSLFNKCYPNSQHPFHKTFTGHATTPKRSLSLNDMRHIIRCSSLIPEFLHVFYDIFLFSVFGLGIPFADVTRLTRNNIHGNMLVYHRRKTGKKISVPLLPEMLEILSRYKTNDDNALLFPVLKSSYCSQTTYHNALCRYNRALGKIGRLLGIEEKMTSYVARHTWATLANEAGISIKNISIALGHHSLKTTEIYLKRDQCGTLWHDSVIVERYMRGETDNSSMSRC